MSEPGRGGLTDAERENLKSLGRYALAIFAAVSVTLIVVSVIANVLQIGT